MITPAPMAALLTPEGRGAVATVAIDGAHAAAIVGPLLEPPRSVVQTPSTTQTPFGRIRLCRWQSGEEVVVCERSACRIEIHCHGGRAAVAAILDSLSAAGCQVVDGAAWLGATEPNGIAAAALLQLARATTFRTAAILLDQAQGALAASLDQIANGLTALERGTGSDRRDVQRQIAVLLERAAVGLHLTEPFRVVLAGRPNVGKSSLLNALAGYRRAIVHDTPGTTRDVVTAATAFDGWPVELADTAGLHLASDEIEQAGIDRAQQRLATADLVLWVEDASIPPNGASELASAAPSFTVFNKCDLAAAPEATLGVSALTGEGLEGLKEELARRLVPHPPHSGEAIPFTKEQVLMLAALAELTGRGDYATAREMLATFGRGGGTP